MVAGRAKLVLVVILAFACLAAWPRARVAYLAVITVAESATPEVDGPIARLRADPLVEATSFSAGGKVVQADVYRPRDAGPHPGIVLTHGVADLGRRDPRLVNFADALARAGYVALVPDFENLREFRVRPSDVEEIVAAFEHLEGLPKVKPGRIGLFGFSYAGGLILLAASNPSIADRVRFCFLLGGYCDLENVITYMTTGRFRDGDGWTYLEPRNSGRWAFLLNSADLVQDVGDRRLLVEIARAKWDDPDRDVSALVARMGDEGRRVYALMVNEDPEMTHGLIGSLNPRIRAYVQDLTLPGKLERLRAHLIIVHGRDDSLIPYTESVLLARSVPQRASVHLALVSSFQHVDIDLGGGGGITGKLASLAEAWRLFSVTYDLLAQGLL